MRLAVALAFAAALAGCAGLGDDRVVVQLEELNGSGISGTATLEPTGDSWTRMTVTVEGGTVTAAWIATGACPDTGDEIITIHPPTGRAPIGFDGLTKEFEARPYAAVFLRRGRFVACGSI